MSKLWKRGVLETLTNYHIPDSKPIVYAATTDKRLARKFERCRNMNYFKRVIKDISREEAEFDNWSIRISEKSLLFDDHKHIVVPLTGTEEWCADNASEIILDNLQKTPLINPFVFCDEIQLALFHVGYTEQCILEFPSFEYSEIYDAMLEKYGELPPLDGIQEWQNELGMFLWMFNEVVDGVGILAEGEVDDESLETIRRYKDIT